MLNIMNNNDYFFRVLWNMNMSLEQTPLEGEESILDQEDENTVGLCEHWLLDNAEGGLQPEDKGLLPALQQDLENAPAGVCSADS